MKKPQISRRALLRALFYSSPVVVAGHAFLWEPEWVKISTRRLTDAKPRHRFIHLSDLHHKGDRAYLESVVRKINALSPEFVCFTGDIVEDRAYLAEALVVIGQIKAPVFGVPGNHDRWISPDRLAVEQAFAATGGGWLVERQSPIPNSSIVLTGTACDSPLKAGPVKGMTNILLMHYPTWADNLGEHRFDLLLAGHSHGGQVRVPFYGALLLPDRVGKYELGHYQTSAGPLYVNAGIGWFYMAVRFNCRPEITVFEI